MTDDPRTWRGQLQDGELAHIQHPDTFDLPPEADRRTLELGRKVKLGLLLAPGAHGAGGERPWFEIVERTEDGYIGRLLNDPVLVDELAAGDLVAFGPQHVLSIWEGEPDQ